MQKHYLCANVVCSMYINDYVCMYVWVSVSLYVCMYVCMYVCVYVCMSVSLYVGVYAFSSIIFNYSITTFITIHMAICFTLIILLSTYPSCV